MGLLYLKGHWKICRLCENHKPMMNILRRTFLYQAIEKLKLPLIFSKIRVTVNYNHIFRTYIIFVERKDFIEKLVLFYCIWYNC